MSNDIWKMMRRSAQAVSLHFFPPDLLIVVQLARQGFHGNAVLGAELSPKQKPQVVLAR
jgi:hypothetical protein